MEMLGKLRENGLHHARTAQTRRSPAMRVQPAMEVEERPDAASSPGSPCSLQLPPRDAATMRELGRDARHAMGCLRLGRTKMGCLFVCGESPSQQGDTSRRMAAAN